MDKTRAELIKQIYSEMVSIAKPKMLSYQSDLDTDLKILNASTEDILFWAYRQTGTNIIDLTPASKAHARTLLTYKPYLEDSLFLMHWFELNLRKGSLKAVSAKSLLQRVNRVTDPIYLVVSEFASPQYSNWLDALNEYRFILKQGKPAWIQELNTGENCTK